MEYTREQISRFKEEFAIRRRRQRVVSGGLLLMFLAMMFGSGLFANFGLPQGVMFGLLLVALFGAIVHSLWNWRCPACSVSFGRLWNPRFCPNCGAPLRD